MGLLHQTTAKLKQRPFPFQTLNFHHVKHRRQYRLMPQEFVQHIWCIQDALAEQYIYIWNKKCSVHIPDMQLGQSIYKRCMGCMRDSVHIQPAHTLKFVNSLVQKSKSCFFPTRFKALSTQVQIEIKKEMHKCKNEQNSSAQRSFISASSFQNRAVEVYSKDKWANDPPSHIPLHLTLFSLWQLREFQV